MNPLRFFLALPFFTVALLGEVSGSVRDADSGQIIPSRVYVRSAEGKWFFPKSASSEGTALEFRRQPNPSSVEMHTTLSAHPFTVDLPPGSYEIMAERGKEYLPARLKLEVGAAPVAIDVKLKRWINMAERGWYSGDTHAHRSIAEMRNLMMAEDVNAAFPLTYWVTVSDTSPQAANKAAGGAPSIGETLALDATHSMQTMNTEYEIFTTGGKSHTLGAFLILGHKSPMKSGLPPVGPVLEQARREGALIDLEKHSWPWSVAMVPVMKIDLYELSNNHVWQTQFGFPQWTLSAAGKYMNLEMDGKGFTEWGWIDFGFKTYYAFLNCGFRFQPTAGTASGVHPVPFGFGRVYVHLPEGFTSENWMKGLKAGRSFVTTGPMLFVKVNGAEPGSALHLNAPGSVRVEGSLESSAVIERIEIIVNGQIAKTVEPANQPGSGGLFRTPLHESVRMESSGWVAVRAFEKNGGRRNRFAHSSPVHFEVPGQPLRPRREEVDYFITRVQEEISRNQGVISEAALDEYRRALKIYETIRATAN